ncbi:MULTISPECIES: hypothetical protein [unclassified Arthrobacter]|uniref:hypothetical protein n=1 Tax=unclassified Arthrobacter TaxID=235627 RepID=UPI001F1B9A8C|nr:hypothetical protein [Arthrobacter sp. FW306-06-A]UKA71395.1 hypothetical protein LFT49_01175 [Arthrobacter sp. FW306-06-A]
MMPAQAPLTLPRALTVAGLILGIAAAAHTAGGGRLPATPLLVLLAALVMLPVTVLARRKLGLGTITTALGTGQLALHAAFTAFPSPVEHCTAAGIAAHGHHQSATFPGCLTATGTMAAHVTGVLPGPVMTGAHILAVAATALLLAHGETMLWRMLDWLAPRSFALHLPVLPHWTTPAPPAGLVIPRLHPCLRIPALRGPPTASSRAVAAFAA